MSQNDTPPAGALTTAPPNQGGIPRILPQNMAELERLATLLCKSHLVPKDLLNNPASTLIVLMHGNEVGLSPSQALCSIMVVNGRPAMWGDAVWGKVEASNLVEAWNDSWDEKTKEVVFRVKRKGREWVERRFGEADAKAAGLSGKDTYKSYPRRMYFQRARSWAARDVFPDVLKGLRVVEEERDVIPLQPAPDGSFGMMPKEKPAAEAPKDRQPEDRIGKEEGKALTDAMAANKVTGEDLREYLAAQLPYTKQGDNYDPSLIQVKDFDDLMRWVKGDQGQVA